MNIVEVFEDIFEKKTKHSAVVKSVATINNNEVQLVSKGLCWFQLAIKQRIDLSEEILPTALTT
jgi:hypothetical protein